MSINVNSFVPNSKIFDKINLTTDNKATSNDPNTSGTSFMDVLKSKIDGVNDKQIASEDATASFIKGDSNISVDQVMLSGEEAKQSLQLAVEIRNKLIDAFQEINKTQM